MAGRASSCGELAVDCVATGFRELLAAGAGC